MNITQAALRSLLIASGLPATLWQLPDASYETVSSDWVLQNWQAWLDCRPESLVVWEDVDAGGKRIRVRQRPLWLADSDDCDNLALGLMSHGDVGNALAAVAGPGPRGGLAFGVQFFIAGPARPENFNVAGGHAINWFVDHSGTVQWFEPGVGQLIPTNVNERASAWFGLAA